MSDESVKMERSHRIYCGSDNEKQQQQRMGEREEDKEEEEMKSETTVNSNCVFYETVWNIQCN